jgi:hypothetical protein
VEDPVVHGQDLVPCRLLPPQRHQFGQPVRMLGGQVVDLGVVLSHVVELPGVVVERGVVVGGALVVGRADGLVGDRLPPLVVEGPAPEHLEVLGLVAPGCTGPVLGQQVGEAGAVDGPLRHVVDGHRRVDAHELEHGGQDVDGVGELVADATARGAEAGRPVDDARIGHPALVDLPLPPLERGVAGHGPPPRVVVVGRRCPELVDARPQLLGARGVTVPQAPVVDGAVRAALGAGAVVGDQDHQGVVELAALVEEAEQPADLGIGVGQEGGEALHEAGRHPLVLGRDVVPGRHPRRPGRQFGARRDDAQLELAGVGGLAPGVPAAVEPAPEPLEPLLGRMVG